MTHKFIYLLFVVAVGCKSPHNTPDEKRNIPATLRDGDIAFRRGMGFMSQVVLVANSSGSFSHVGIICQINDRWCVIHEVPYEGCTPDDDKIYCEEVEGFFDLQKASMGGIYRLEGVDSAQCRRACSYALEQLRLGTPFDHDYNLENETHQYCSELVWRSYLSAGVDITKGSRTHIVVPQFSGVYILPSDIENNSELTMIWGTANLRPL